VAGLEAVYDILPVWSLDFSTRKSVQRHCIGMVEKKRATELSNGAPEEAPEIECVVQRGPNPMDNTLDLLDGALKKSPDQDFHRQRLLVHVARHLISLVWLLELSCVHCFCSLSF
jgi:hypothetical protein